MGRKQMANLKEAFDVLRAETHDVFFEGHAVLCVGIGERKEVVLEYTENMNFTIKPKKPVFTDFGNCFDWINAYAMDKNGRWWGYEAAPKVTRWNNWGDINGDSILIPREYAPKFDGDWKDSLCVREV